MPILSLHISSHPIMQHKMHLIQYTNYSQFLVHVDYLSFYMTSHISQLMNCMVLLVLVVKINTLSSLVYESHNFRSDIKRIKTLRRLHRKFCNYWFTHFLFIFCQHFTASASSQKCKRIFNKETFKRSFTYTGYVPWLHRFLYCCI